MSADVLQASWEDLMDDMYGGDDSLKKAVYESAMIDSKVSDSARRWLKKTYKVKDAIAADC
ncbi:MAG: hypothetical protein K2Y18_09175 [Alphaproteobacteria bacterium]|jgi:hypothetical protein|nr:hypothetical protein [Alphaproteobacteria bacterium]